MPNIFDPHYVLIKEAIIKCSATDSWLSKDSMAGSFSEKKYSKVIFQKQKMYQNKYNMFSRISQKSLIKYIFITYLIM